MGCGVGGVWLVARMQHATSNIASGHPDTHPADRACPANTGCPTPSHVLCSRSCRVSAACCTPSVQAPCPTDFFWPHATPAASGGRTGPRHWHAGRGPLVAVVTGSHTRTRRHASNRAADSPGGTVSGPGPSSARHLHRHLAVASKRAIPVAHTLGRTAGGNRTQRVKRTCTSCSASNPTRNELNQNSEVLTACATAGGSSRLLLSRAQATQGKRRAHTCSGSTQADRLR